MKATQTLKIDKECKHSIRYAPVDDTCTVDGKTIKDELTSGIYVNRSLLARLGDPATLTLTVEA